MDVIEVEKRDEDTKTGVYPGVQGTRHGERLANSVRRREKGEPTKTLYSRGHPGPLLTVLVTIASVQDRDGARLLPRDLPGGCKKLRSIWVDG
jgi:hypothetical protein